VDSGGPKEPCIGLGPDRRVQRAIFGKKHTGQLVTPHRGKCARQPLALSPTGQVHSSAVGTGEYDSTARVRRRCGLLSYYFDHLLVMLHSINTDHFPYAAFVINSSVILDVVSNTVGQLFH